MSLLVTFILGLVQGLTEFLPVSSSGHLALLQNLFGDVNVGLDVLLHLGTLLAVLVYFYKDILMIIRDFFRWEKTENFRMGVYIIFATIPAAIVGYLVEKFVVNAFSNLIYIALGFLLSGLFLFTASFSKGNRNLTFRNTFVSGIAQALAVFPGVSRSAAVVSTLLIGDVDRTKALRFAFLLSIPVIFGAALLNIEQIIHLNFSTILVGLVVSFLAGLLGIFIFMKFVYIRHIRWFAYYCWLLAILIFILKIVF